MAAALIPYTLLLRFSRTRCPTSFRSRTALASPTPQSSIPTPPTSLPLQPYVRTSTICLPLQSYDRTLPTTPPPPTRWSHQCAARSEATSHGERSPLGRFSSRASRDEYEESLGGEYCSSDLDSQPGDQEDDEADGGGGEDNDGYDRNIPTFDEASATLLPSHERHHQF